MILKYFGDESFVKNLVPFCGNFSDNLFKKKRGGSFCFSPDCKARVLRTEHFLMQNRITEQNLYKINNYYLHGPVHSPEVLLSPKGKI